MKRAALWSLLLVATCSSAMAQSREDGSYWSIYSSDETLILLDRNSVSWQGELPTVEWQIVESIPRPVDLYGQTRYVQRQVEKIQLDCNELRARLIETRPMELNGAPFRAEPGPGLWETVRPTSIAADAIALVCRRESGGATEYRDLDATIALFLRNVAARRAAGEDTLRNNAPPPPLNQASQD